MLRKAIKELKNWKASQNRKPLIVNGARQVGKTWLLREFGAQEYSNVAYVRFDNNAVMRSVFERDFDLDRILDSIQAVCRTPIAERTTLLILDEIQECPSALTSLKYFCEEKPEIHIAAAGSLLGLMAHQGTGFPVGKVNYLDLHPMSFSEFLSATGNENLVSLIEEKRWDVLEAVHLRLLDLVRQYCYVGGMPEVVLEFVQTHDYQRVRKVQQTILRDYRNDMSKHPPSIVAARVRQLWDSLPAQLSRENRKFVYGDVQKGLRSKDLEPALQWLIDSGLALQVNRVTKPAAPLAGYTDGAFKLFMLDIGLLGAMVQLDSATLIDGNKVFTEYKGALMEQFVAQEILAECNIQPFYWTGTRAELDFLCDFEWAIVPIEVKAALNLKAKSLKEFCRKFKMPLAFRFSQANYGTAKVSYPDESIENIGEYELIDYPLYAVSSLSREQEFSQ